MRSLLLAASLLAAQASAQPSCGCAPFDRRDYALFSHRKIADDLVRREGVYLASLLDALASCPDRKLKTEWLRRVATDTADTAAFANRIALAFEQGDSCVHTP